MLNGPVALLGSGEYLPVMDDTDLALLAGYRKPGHRPRVVCIPTAAGREGEEVLAYWMNLGLSHFQALDADVSALHIANRAEADEPGYAARIAAADLIYFSGGKPAYLYKVMHGSLAWQAVLSATRRGAAYAGCSAGSMVMGAWLPNLKTRTMLHSRAFGILPFVHILPHFDRHPVWNRNEANLQAILAPGEFLLALDEETAVVRDSLAAWTVYGRQQAHLFSRSQVRRFSAGQTFSVTVSN